jgi:small subunit ribosomal protein S16
MAVRIRMKRLGRRNRPYFRIDVMDARTQRDGRSLETVGTYDPMEADEAKKVTLKEERIRHWLSVGAKPTEVVENILKQKGIELPWAKKPVQKAGEKPKKEKPVRKAAKPAEEKKKKPSLAKQRRMTRKEKKEAKKAK